MSKLTKREKDRIKQHIDASGRKPWKVIARELGYKDVRCLYKIRAKYFPETVNKKSEEREDKGGTHTLQQEES